MTTLSIAIPDHMAYDSLQAAKTLGVSRTQFIRQAIKHELENSHKYREQEAMAHAFVAMKKDKHYLAEAEEIMNYLNSDLPEEKDNWWIK